MLYNEKKITLKNGHIVTLRNALVEDASRLLSFVRQLASETEYILTYPEEYDSMTIESEEAFINRTFQSPNDLMITCLSNDGAIIANCHMSYKTKLKNKHRAVMGIGILKAYWNLGLGQTLISEMVRVAKSDNIEQLELEVIETNDRGIRLYEKMGFVTTSFIPNAIKLKDGRILKEFYMIKDLRDENAK
jgi:ribosomal protein S18 acetylase RimI-like enzyme